MSKHRKQKHITTNQKKNHKINDTRHNKKQQTLTYKNNTHATKPKPKMKHTMRDIT